MMRVRRSGLTCKSVLADDNEGIYDKSQADMRHRQYIKRLEDSSKKSQVGGFDNLLTKGVNAALSAYRKRCVW